MDIIAVAEGLSGLPGYSLLFFLVLLLSASLFLPLPVVAVVAAAASVLDPLAVGIIAGIASAIGELSGYAVGLGSEKVLRKKRKEGSRYNHAKEIFERWGFWGIVAATIFPITPIDFVGIIAGALRYSYKKFLLAAILGKIPRYLIVAFAGKAVIEAIL